MLTSSWTMWWPNFNPRSHEGSDWVRLPTCPAWRNFNPRSHEGSDTRTTRISDLIIPFQSTLPRGERRVADRYGVQFPEFQSTLPRGERRHLPHQRRQHQAISIHAPTRGATLHSEVSGGVAHISIHAPTRGATASTTSTASTPSNFNPRSHEGSDNVVWLVDLYQKLFQSTLPRGERRGLS